MKTIGILGVLCAACGFALILGGIRTKRLSFRLQRIYLGLFFFLVALIQLGLAAGHIGRRTGVVLFVVALLALVMCRVVASSALLRPDAEDLAAWPTTQEQLRSKVVTRSENDSE